MSIGATTIATTLATLKARLSGAGLSGLDLAQVREKLESVETGRLPSLLFEHRSVREEFTARMEAARAAGLADAVRLAQAAADEGRAGSGVDYEPGRDERMKAVADGLLARKSEFGCAERTASASEVLEAIVRRESLIEAELRRRYEREGEPAGLVKLRAEIARAKAETWPLIKAVDEARKKLQALGAALCEQEVLAAVAARAAAERKVAELTARIYRDHGLSPGRG